MRSLICVALLIVGLCAAAPACQSVSPPAKPAVPTAVEAAPSLPAPCGSHARHAQRNVTKARHAAERRALRSNFRQPRRARRSHRKARC